MPVSALAPTGARRKAALSFAQDLLDWIYTELLDPDECRLKFWLLFTGLTPRQARTRGKEAFDRMQDHSRRWDWKAMQRWLRETTEAQLGNVDKDRGPAFRLAPRRLVTIAPDKGRNYVEWRPTLSADFTAEETAAFLLDQVLTEISGASVEAFGRCKSCKRYLIRQRRARQQYCSDRCRVRDRRGRQKQAAKPRPTQRRRGTAKRSKR